MNFKISKRIFYNALQTVARAISPNSPLPALSGIKIEVDQESITLTGSDADTSICKTLNSTDEDLHLFVKETGSIILESRYILEIVRKIDAEDVEIEIIDGDQIMAIVGNHMKSQGKLEGNRIIATIMSNLGFFLMGERNDINIEQTRVGDRYVLERMKEIKASLGGEQSGHVIFLDENTTGDGLLSALHLLQVIVETGKPLSELKTVMEVMPQALVNAKVPNHKKEKYMDYPEIADAIAELDKKFAGVGLDVYEEEEGIFYEDRSGDIIEDENLARLVTFPNVLITSHMGFFTTEAMQAIAIETLENAYALENGLPLLNRVGVEAG